LILNELQKVGKPGGQGGGKYRFREILPNAIDNFYQLYDKKKNLNLTTDVARELSTTLASIMVHGVGADKLVGTYMNALRIGLDKNPKSTHMVDEFLGSEPTDRETMNRRIRSLPVKSVYAQRLVKNLYKEC